MMDKIRARDQEREPDAVAGSLARPLRGIGAILRRSERQTAPDFGTVEIKLVDGRQLSVGEFLREHWEHVTPTLQPRLAYQHFNAILDASVLHRRIASDDPNFLPPPDDAPQPKRSVLPAETVLVLRFALLLRRFVLSPEEYRRTKETLRQVRESFPSGGDPTTPVPVDEDLNAYLRVERELGLLEDSARDAAQLVAHLGYRWNWTNRTIEIPTGKRSRQLLRDLVRVLLLEFNLDRNTAEAREMIARELAPFLPRDLLDTSKGSKLYNAVDNALRT